MRDNAVDHFLLEITQVGNYRNGIDTISAGIDNRFDKIKNKRRMNIVAVFGQEKMS